MSTQQTEPLPERIFFKNAGTILARYTGPEKKLDLGGGIYITIKPGDYTGYSAHCTEEWLRANPSRWESRD